MNILISSLGLKVEIVEEALGLFNYSCFDLYESSQYKSRIETQRNTLRTNGDIIDEVWLIANEKEENVKKHLTSIQDDFHYLQEQEDQYGVVFRLFVLDNIRDITNEKEARAYHNMALEACFLAHHESQGGKVYVSLACGRKTMSADLQDAAYCFGCDQMIHVLGDSKDDAQPLLLGAVQKNESLKGLTLDKGVIKIMHYGLTDDFLRVVEERKSSSQHFYTTYYLEQGDRANFHILYTLPPSTIERLKNEKIGTDRSNENAEIEYLHRLPKTELHCHLGGVLSPKEMIEVAECYREAIEKEKAVNSRYASFLDDIPHSIKQLLDKSIDIKTWSKNHSETMGIDRPLIVAPVILAFEQDPELFEKLIYDDLLDEKKFKGITITPYEALGDFQGSALLCDEAAIRKTVQILLRNCISENVKYLEVRCSPMNYATKAMSGEKVLFAIMEELERAESKIKSSVIIIASRHGGEKGKSKITDSIEMVKRLKGNELFVKYFRGFDLAGNEAASEAKEFRQVFLEIMHECYNITIHAGEHVSSESIWQAIYYLNAERIGHGLTLSENKELLNKLLERAIGIELCPSSNYQIIGYRDNYLADATASDLEYPLKEYLQQELKVCINTDDPGISRTNITKELLKAARMTQGGLSKWEILQLLCNGFRNAFYPYKKKRELIQHAEQCLAQLIKNGQL